MNEEIKLPEISENIDSGEVVKLLVSIGDFIKVDQPILEMETEKAVFEVPSPISGKVVDIKVKEGDTVKVGQVILEIEKGNGKEQKPEKKIEKEEIPEEETKKDIKEIVSENDKKKNEEAKILKGKVEISKKREEPVQLIPASPSVRRFAREVGANINEIKGTGPGGRISVDDVKNHVRQKISEQKITPSIVQEIPLNPIPDFSRWGNIERRPMSSMRKITARNMLYSWRTVPHVTQYDKADITELEKLRKLYAKMVEQAGGKLTITSYLMKITSLALKEFPQFNASLDLENEEIIYKKYYNIGIAVDTDRGLLVPVVKDVENKNIIELSIELKNLSEKSRDKKLTLEEMEGGNITISNLGGIGGTNFSPIVYTPQVAIIGVSQANTEAVYYDNRFEPRLMLPLSLSYDHRVIDGADGTRFLHWIKEVLQEPFLAALII